MLPKFSKSIINIIKKTHKKILEVNLSFFFWGGDTLNLLPIIINKFNTGSFGIISMKNCFASF